MPSADRRLSILGAVWGIGLVSSGWAPFDRATWWMEIAPVLIAFPVLVGLRRRFVFTDLALLLIAVHGLVLMLGGAYTYARVPIGFAVQDWLHLARNPYDRFGHLMQGFVPAIVLREVLVRSGVIAAGRVLAITVLAYCLSVSALYELIEFGAAVALGQGADAFLGTQGDPWDTQWDMLMCLIGAALALILLSRPHDRQIARLRSSYPATAWADHRFRRAPRP
jgi:putative membrane protein